ncbi:MAG: hypothetical protein HPM95_01630 [Alphaproteobacteria bacterium]|nr:hypothetical protein [Alphaproteobacteria bacterium]
MISVFGSINLDLVVSLPRLPAPGETIVGPDHQSFSGGKGQSGALPPARRQGAHDRRGRTGCPCRPRARQSGGRRRRPFRRAPSGGTTGLP